uniref:Uncharacterized protein n=1 Tax=Mycena chlorophos TaxID=658473 RepID=A0ABQ0LJI9_MYCCL|nr:predicted protein [Mycena chlorophos]
MSSFTTSLFGSISRVLFPFSPSSPTASKILESDSVPDLASADDDNAGNLRALPRPASSAACYQRPSSAVEIGGYWSWESDGGVVLRRRSASGEHELLDEGRGRKARPHVSSVFAFQPPGAYYTPSIPYGFPSPEAMTTPIVPSRLSLSCLSIDEPSFDLSLISDSSTITSGSDEVDHDASLSFSFTLPDADDVDADAEMPETPFFPPAGTGLGLGIGGLFNANGAAFDGMGVVGLGLQTEDEDDDEEDDDKERGVSRVLLEEVAWTWAQDRRHRMLSVISEGSSGDEDLDVELDDEDVSGSEESVQTESSGTTGGQGRRQLRDLSAMGTISSQLKRAVPRLPIPRRSMTAPAASSSAAATPRSDTPGGGYGFRRARAGSHPPWRI